MSDKRTQIRESRKSTFSGRAAGWLMRLYCATFRYDIEDRCGFSRGEVSGPVIYCLWHDGILSVPYAWRKICRKPRRLAVLTSASHDGAVLAHAMSVFGIDAVRGSSSRRAVAALVGMRKALREGSDICITPDGPRGPRHVVQPGVLKLAETGGAPLVPVHVECSSAWRLKTWDRFMIPRPFSRVRVIFDEALAVPAGLADDDFEAWRRRLEGILRRGAGETLSEEVR